MTVDHTNLQTLVSVPSEMEAAVIVNVLEAYGIPARATGGFTSGFKAEAPGDVSVLVGQTDLGRAKEILAEIQRERGEIDSGPPAEPLGESPGTASPLKRRRLQFSLAALLVLLTIESVVLATWKGFGAAGLCIVAMFIVLGVATMGVASDLSRAHKVWVYVGRLLTVGAVMLALFVLIREIMKILSVIF